MEGIGSEGLEQPVELRSGADGFSLSGKLSLRTEKCLTVVIWILFIAGSGSSRFAPVCPKFPKKSMSTVKNQKKLHEPIVMTPAKTPNTNECGA